MRSRSLKRFAFPFSHIVPAFVFLIAIIIVPTVYLLWASLQQWIVINPNIFFIGFGNFVAVIKNQEFRESLWVTGKFTLYSTALTTLLGLFLALSLQSKFRGNRLLRTIFVLPLVTPPIVSGLAWKFLLHKDVGLIGNYVAELFNFQSDILGSPDWALIGILIAECWSKTAFMFVIIMASLEALPKEIYEAAKIDGAGSVQVFNFITLPLLLPSIIIGMFFRAVDAMNTFDLIFVMTRGGPGTTTQTLSILGWKTAFTYFDIGKASAMTVLLNIIALILVIFLSRRLFR